MDDGVELHSLLSQTILDWSVVHRRIKRHPEEAQQRHYRNESPLQLALMASADESGERNNIGRIHVLQALADADPTSLHSRDNEGTKVMR